ncbi:hypothetical protein ACIPJN_30045 [Streptomyces sp. NPDC086796]|uniref:hypothetical protein n=1 Tax=Streptomyces sp. NPDC086796 TaxID=3365760 RepID=UPI0037F77DF4
MGTSTVQGYGWELQNSSSRDAFYRFLVFLTPEPALVTLYGPTGGAGTATVTLVDSPADVQVVIDKACKICGDKERGDYELSRDYTRFEVPAELAARGDFKANAHAIAAYFRDSARAQGTELANASPIPSA